MPGPDFLSQLPALDELLENPRIKSTIDRVNRSNAAAQVRAALSGLGAEVSRRAEELQAIAPGELLDKLVRRLSDPVTPVASPLINATGDLFGGWSAPPLAPAAREAVLAATEGFRREGGASAAVATRLLPCEAAHVFSSPVAALGVALESLAAGGEVVVSRGEMRELAGGVRLDDVARRAGVTLREVGATDTATLADYESALDEAKSRGAQSLLVLQRPDGAGGASPAAPELATLAARFGATHLVDCGPARLRKDTPNYEDPTPAVEERLASGAELALVATSGRIGGPVACLLVGKQAAVSRVAEGTASAADTLDPMIDAALAATLELFARPDALRFAHPLHQLLDAPLENLRTRAERLAPQIAEGTGVASAEVLEVTPRDSPVGLPGCRIEIRAEGDPSALIEAVHRYAPGLALGACEGGLYVDLRSVFAGQDRSIAAAFYPEIEAVPSERAADKGAG